jgi:hypothetical protein
MTVLESLSWTLAVPVATQIRLLCCGEDITLSVRCRMTVAAYIQCIPRSLHLEKLVPKELCLHWQLYGWLCMLSNYCAAVYNIVERVSSKPMYHVCTDFILPTSRSDILSMFPKKNALCPLLC